MTPAAAPSLPDPSQRAVLAAALLAVDPLGLGGALLRSTRRDRTEAWLDALRALLPAQVPFARIPVAIPDDRLLGGLDLALTLATGQPVAERGLLTRADGGVLVLPSAERAGAGLVGRLVNALDTRHVLPRVPAAAESPARFTLVVLDEGEADEAPVAEALSDRLAFRVELSPGDADAVADGEDVAMARRRLADVSMGDAGLRTLVDVATAFGVASLRAVSFAVRAACAAAALDGRARPSEDDLTLAATLVLAPRATRRPVAPEEQPEPAPPEPAEPPEARGEDEGPALNESRGLEDRVVAAVATLLPVRLSSDEQRPRRGGGTEGRAGSDRRGGRRGRQVGTRRGDPRAGGRLDLLETLRAAAPWQRLRTRPPGTAPAGAAPAGSVRQGTTSTAPARSPRARIEVRPDDFRLRHLVEPAGTTAIFVVDASGSAAVHRLNEAKGAVELLLADAYARRDEVGVIAFRGTAADVLLPPTRAIAAAKRALAALPGGGGTPLAHGIDRARELVGQARRAGNDTVVVFLTDARANIARDGTPGRPQAEVDAIRSAHALRALGGTVLFIDTSPRPSAQAQAIATALGARYVALPRTDARGIHAEVSASFGARA